MKRKEILPRVEKTNRCSKYLPPLASSQWRRARQKNFLVMLRHILRTGSHMWNVQFTSEFYILGHWDEEIMTLLKS
jgi:hypothetical protein